jgi:nitrite reductase (NADH) large subunit
VSRRYLLVGSGVAALSAAEAIRGADPAGRITVVSTEADPFYSRPGLAYLLTGEVGESSLAIRSPRELAALGLERVVGEATGLQPDRHELLVSGGRRIEYDALLLATGAESIKAEFPGASLDGVLQVDGLAEARGLVARAQRASAAVVVGGGSTALELVEGLHAQGVATHYLMRGERYWSKVLDPVESAIVEARLLADGVTLHRRAAVREAIGDGGRLVAVRLEDGRTLPVDILAVAIGVRPRLSLATSAGLVTDRGILTSPFLETSAPDVFAAGDCAQVHDPVTRTAALDTLWASAAQQGRIAGLNMAGVRVPHRKRAPINVTRLGGVTATIIGAVGAGNDPDLLTLTRGQSERWVVGEDAWQVRGARRGDRLRVVVSGRTIVGAVVMGDQSVSHALAHLIGEEVDISGLRPALEAEPDQALDLLLAFCTAHVGDHAAAHR